ncbi:hypothetical protein ASF61_06190 [Duganella sp. Leaf126]|uniref:TolC family protein n=1 Tax=Duganella sp. Leaf126 TaxID=1736266 RepID=UPI0006FD4691|nr:TolC family protein [Duganella sp. Leaf126]KQQ40353.1 hypothetical protein ASF61_06190 [Duganella sp. Leaf126]
MRTASVLVLGAMVWCAAARAGVDSAPVAGQPWPVATGQQSLPVRPFTAPDAADPATQTTSWTLAQLSNYALAHNPATKAAWAGALADQFGVDGARALLKPAVNANIPFTISRASGADASGVTRTVSPSLSLAWIVFDAGARADAVEAAQWQELSSRLLYNRELQTVLNDVEQSYFTLLGARQLAAAAEVTVAAARTSADAARARRSAGVGTAGDTAQADAALSLASLQLVQAQSSARSAAGQLASAVGLPVTSALALADDGAPLADQPNLPGVDQLLAMARLTRADLASSQAQLRQGEAQLRATRAQGLPTLALSAQLNRSFSNNTSPAGSRTIGLALSFPLYDGGLVRAQTGAAQARVEQLAAQSRQQQQSVELEVWQSFQGAASASAVIASARDLLASASEAEAAARERYRVGVGTLLELMVAQSDAAQARVSLIQAQYGARLAYASLAYAVGSRSALAENQKGRP